MSELILWKDQEMNKWRRDIERLFDLCWSSFGTTRFIGEVSEGFSAQLSETQDTIIVRAKLEGIKAENLDVSVTHDTLLTIKAEKTEQSSEDDEYYTRVKNRLSSFRRTIRLPCRVRVGEIKATYRKGILEIIMPKWRPQKPRGIKVEVMP